MSQNPRTLSPTGQFPTTRWSLVRAVKTSDGDQRRELLGTFLGRYRSALEAYLRLEFRWIRPEDQEDLIQSFIIDKVISRKLLDHAAESRGKLRYYLKTSLRNYVIDSVRHSKYRAQHEKTSLNEQLHETATRSRHTDSFELVWARQVVQETIERFRQDTEARGRPVLWQVFEKRLLNPAMEGAEPIAIERLCEMFDMQPKRVYNLVITARRNFSRHLKDVVSEYATDDQDIDNEIRELLNHLHHGYA